MFAFSLVCASARAYADCVHMDSWPKTTKQEMSQDKHESERNDPGRNNKRTVGETDLNEKIGVTAE